MIKVINQDKLYEILTGLPLEIFQKKWIIPSSSIQAICKTKGYDNWPLIKSLLKSLSQQGRIELEYNNAPGFEDLIIGVTLL